MKNLKIANRLEASEIALGCMRITGLEGTDEVRELVDTAMEHGINFFDHADIYGNGESEHIFGEAIKGIPREKMIVQTKCGIRPGLCYDFLKNLKIANRLEASEIALGCMRITGLEGTDEVRELVDTAMEHGINFFDHADIYGNGESEHIFGEAIKGIPREKMIVQTKCGIRPGLCYDFSKEHILESVDKSLKRLNMDYIDVLLLHRPDTLMEPEEVAEAFNILEKEGKVRYFGVSNQNSMQMELLQRYCSQKLIINQLQFSVAHCDIIDSGLNVNVHNDAGCVRDGSILEYCRLKEVTIQAWSPFQYGFFEGVFIGSEKFPELNKMLDELAEKYHVTSSAIAIAWILRHPAGIQAILGSTKKQRIAEICKASEIKLTREEWYALYQRFVRQVK